MKECFNRHSFCTQKGISVYKLYGIIYCARNLINDKKYIGQTTRELKRRRNEHIAQANNGSELAIHQAIKKYGEDSFEWCIIDQTYNQEDLDEREIYWIDYYDSYRNGYNMTLGGQFDMGDCPDAMSLARGGREFLVFDLDGSFIDSRVSQTAFADEVGVCVGTVNNVLLEIKQSTCGYILIFKEDFSEKKLKYKINKIKNRHKPFAVFTKDWDFIGIWDNKMRCAEEIGMTRRNIQRQLNDDVGRKRPKKYRLYYLDEIPDKYKYKIKEVI